MTKPLEHGSWFRRTETMLGVTLAVTPVTLWVAWTPSIFLAVVALAAASAALLVVLHGLGAPGEQDAARQPGASKPELPEGFVEEVHGLFPLTYHHSRIESPRFRRAMQRLRRSLR